MRTQKNPEKHYLYLKAFRNTAKAYSENQQQDPGPFIKKLIVYGIKAVNTKPEPQIITYDEAVNNFQFANVILSLIGTLTPSEFVNLFPIEKEYKGHKWQMKDYFYTRDYIKSLDPLKPIGEDALKFIWEYTNWEITEFNVEIMGYMSSLRRLEGQPSLMEEWADMNGLKTYTMHTDQQGREFLFDGETGKTIRLKKKPPRYLKVIK